MLGRFIRRWVCEGRGLGFLVGLACLVDLCSDLLILRAVSRRIAYTYLK